MLSVIISILVIVILIEYQNQKEIKEVKSFLKLDGLNNIKGKVVKSKRGLIDPRILWIVLALAILFLLWRAFS